MNILEMDLWMSTAPPTNSTNLMMSPLIEEPPNNCTFYEWSRNPVHAKFFRIFSIISVLTVLVVVVVLGNALVIAAVLLRRRLRSATGLLILSLAVADLLVGIVILPFSIANEVLDQYWIFGESWCTIWLTMDIWMCTASIYNLVAISIDRYIAIIKPLNYPMLVTKFRARCTVAIVWIGSFIICSPSFFLASSIKNKDTPCHCTPANAGRAYVVFSASSSFYIPMIIVVFVYFRIYIAARAATKSIYSGMMSVTATANKKNATTKSYLLNHPNVLSKDSVPMLRVHRGSSVVSHAAQNKPVKTIHENRYRREDSANMESAADKLRKSSETNTSATNSPNLDAAQKRRRFTQDGGSPRAASNRVASSTANRTQQRIISSESSEDSFGNPSPPTELATNHQDNTLHPKNVETNGCPKSILNSIKEDVKPPPTPSKKSMNPLSMLMRRGQKKKSSGAYEKRLSLEIKAAKTVAIVTGCFIFCWLGFSLVYGLEIKLNDVVWSIVFWLGYLNSALNPVIYTVFNREFRICFKRLLTCHHLNHPTHVKYTNNNSYNSTARSNNIISRPPLHQAALPAPTTVSNNVSPPGYHAVRQ
ncbi:unnamed protein product [Caenorhabditis auriculariae]|uniref:G-protein coupled receptors family 1 profile domain-containing protein n=1 Tax=Caenorhabditis auriculariae TaxID=2777116 RepID=A0A8S1HHR2_9PELO|nr:unnamed protein product [Caenorhabditis auriculariae]